MKLGEKLRKARRERQLTQRELAGKDFTAPFISQVEKGLTMPSLKALITLANRLGYPPGYFLETRAETERDRCDMLINLGRCALILGDLDAADKRLADALRLAEDLGDGIRRATARFHLAAVHGLRGEDPRARVELEAALTEFERYADAPRAAAVHFELGVLKQQSRDYRGAIQVYQRALEALNGTDDPVMEAKIRANLGAAHLSLEESEIGGELIREAAQRSRHFANLKAMGTAAMERAIAAEGRGDREGARAESDRARLVLESMDQVALAARLQGYLGLLAASLGQWEEAGRHHHRSLSLHRCICDRRGEAVALLELARYHQHREEAGPALDRAREALSIAGELDSPGDLARAHFVVGSICRRNGLSDEALPYLVASMRGFEQLSRYGELAGSYYELGELLLAQGRKEEALDYFQKAASLLRGSRGGHPIAGGEREGDADSLTHLDPIR
ncbi:MAG TPA: tetratricopeptide repeat protein [Bacillota bacterium]|nr:tetratricopeptide repeat protein [Bacillota bacterium]